MDLPELPFSVKPEKKLSISDVLRYYRETYAGTEFDPTKNLMVPRRQQMRRPGSEPAAARPLRRRPPRWSRAPWPSPSCPAT